MAFRKSNQPIETKDGIDYLLITLMNDKINKAPDYLLVLLTKLKIIAIIIEGTNVKITVYGWEKIILNYLLSIRKQNINNFPLYNYIISINKRMKNK
jgi:hypothetical protein